MSQRPPRTYGIAGHQYQGWKHASASDIADKIAQEAKEIFRQHDQVQGGTAEIRQLRQAG